MVGSIDLNIAMACDTTTRVSNRGLATRIFVTAPRTGWIIVAVAANKFSGLTAIGLAQDKSLGLDNVPAPANGHRVKSPARVNGRKVGGLVQVNGRLLPMRVNAPAEEGAAATL